jgi:hypothetical protein
MVGSLIFVLREGGEGATFVGAVCVSKGLGYAADGDIAEGSDDIGKVSEDGADGHIAKASGKDAHGDFAEACDIEGSTTESDAERSASCARCDVDKTLQCNEETGCTSLFCAFECMALDNKIARNSDLETKRMPSSSTIASSAGI